MESAPAFARHPTLFADGVLTIVLAGAHGDEFGAVADRIADGIEESSLVVPGIEPPGDEMVRYWRALSRMASCGVPLVEALQALAEDVSNPELVDATAAIRKQILGGKSFCDALRDFPKLFPSEVRSAAMFGGAERDLASAAGRIADAIASGDFSSLQPELEEIGEQRPARAFVNTLLLSAVQQRVSDIHLDPTGDNRVRVRVRVDGVLSDFEPLPDIHVKRPPEVPYNEIANRIKVMAGIDLSEARVPQDGRIELNISGAPVDLRVCIVPAIHGERIVMRILDRRTVHLKLGEIGLLPDDLERIRGLCHLPYGTVLVAGPTGSGKTTLLYGMLMELDRDRQCVVSVEDPVEYYLEGVAQVNVNPQVGRTFATVVRSLLRQDPDVILIGELRDSEMLNLAAQCALTGHLVLTTIHAETAPGGIRRLLDMGLAPFVLNASLAAVISQRLVRILCAHCKQPVQPSLRSLPREAAQWLDGRKDAQFCRPVGCDNCRGTGYRGRDCINEILVPDDRVQELVSAEASAREIRDAAVAAGMRTMLACGIERAARGTTSIEEVLRVVGSEPIA
jgi:type II secretory ATPase GspE/PulE/Tfp pilus assembly ATPase PilB-like protein